MNKQERFIVKQSIKNINTYIGKLTKIVTNSTIKDEECAFGGLISAVNTLEDLLLKEEDE